MPIHVAEYCAVDEGWTAGTVQWLAIPSKVPPVATAPDQFVVAALPAATLASGWCPPTRRARSGPGLVVVSPAVVVGSGADGPVVGSWGTTVTPSCDETVPVDVVAPTWSATILVDPTIGPTMTRAPSTGVVHRRGRDR